MTERDAGLILRALLGSCAGVEGRAVTGPEAVGWIPRSLAPADRDRIVRLLLSPDDDFDPTREGAERSTDRRVALRDVLRLIRVVTHQWGDADQLEGRAA